ncbi:MAG: 16S rRNA (adenine(1518)-N(6)/adenine(1519)-N(6))-dimethyltransferase, partial [Clostridia bacterium]|nr:16S rRNA (adenine(1518)-N(6)/adenine(1519)-N(6))-dimethyltransferase [Clostridia bacterium]
MAQLQKDFSFKKQFGQNFIFDINFLKSLVKGFNLPSNTNVLEIGAGAGTLTEVLAQNFDKVVSVEIDKTLQPTLLSLKQNYNNLDFIFNDILNVELNEIEDKLGLDYCMIANLPYYITSQIVFKFLIDSSKISQMFVMVQK